MSCQIGAIEQRRCATEIADIKVDSLKTCITTQELRIRIKYARKLSVFILWLLNMKPLG